MQSPEKEEPSGAAAPAVAAVRPPPTRAEAPTEAAAPQQEEGQKELVVPRGTFASETPPQNAELAEPAPQAPSPTPSGERSSTGIKGEAKADANRLTPDKGHASSQRMRVARSPERPPFLASEILREDIAPQEPGGSTLNVLLVVAPLFGLAALLLAGFSSLSAMALALVHVALFCLGRVQLPYAQRAAWLCGLSGVPLLVSMWWGYSAGTNPLDLLLAAGIPALSCALYLRAWYRGSVVARGLVAIALLPGCIWAFSMSHRGLLSLEFEWQSWLPALTWYVLVILCLLSLLAFMGDETTGGCTAWALGLCGWYAAYASLRFALDADVEPGLRTLAFAEPVLATVFGIALAQVLSRFLARRSARTEPPSL